MKILLMLILPLFAISPTTDGAGCATVKYRLEAYVAANGCQNCVAEVLSFFRTIDNSKCKKIVNVVAPRAIEANKTIVLIRRYVESRYLNDKECGAIDVSRSGWLRLYNQDTMVVEGSMRSGVVRNGILSRLK
jgi:hypothetical protein